MTTLKTTHVVAYGTEKVCSPINKIHHIIYNCCKHVILIVIKADRLRLWKQQTTKLNTIKSSTNRWINSPLKRKEETILNGMRIGHTRLTHSYLTAIRKKLLYA